MDFHLVTAVFTVSPNKQYRGILVPTIPATTGPVCAPQRICKDSVERGILKNVEASSKSRAIVAISQTYNKQDSQEKGKRTLASMMAQRVKLIRRNLLIQRLHASDNSRALIYKLKTLFLESFKSTSPSNGTVCRMSGENVPFLTQNSVGIKLCVPKRFYWDQHLFLPKEFTY
uniref:Uncharacterized protein n=1 Tax=Glossina palpalis gambiensis TaxID=67801 RepID=A0A1B0C1H7_9MUSC